MIPKQNSESDADRAGVVEPSGKVQLHLRLSDADAAYLRGLAQRRGQTLSGAVSYLLSCAKRSLHG